MVISPVIRRHSAIDMDGLRESANEYYDRQWSYRKALIAGDVI